MHTVLVIGAGLLLLALCALAGRLVGSSGTVGTAALVFLPLWLIGAALNMYVGVKRAGYSVADEAPIFLLVFAIPAAVALFVWWRVH
jgi:hypothetical protein